MTDSEKLDILLSDMQDMKHRMANMEGKIANMESKMVNMEGKMANMEGKMANMESDVTDVKLILKNEIRVNIQRVAEGHLDLSRNLHDAMKPSNEIEMLAIKVRMLETDMRDIKAKLA